MSALCRVSKQLQLYLEFQADKLSNQLQEQQMFGAPAAAPGWQQVGRLTMLPRARLARAAAARVGELVAQQLQGVSDQEDSQPASKRPRAANSDSYSGGDQIMEDADSPLPPTAKKQQQQQAKWVTDRVATPLPAAEVVGPVRGLDEEALFQELLPQFAGGSSSSTINH